MIPLPMRPRLAGQRPTIELGENYSFQGAGHQEGRKRLVVRADQCDERIEASDAPMLNTRRGLCGIVRSPHKIIRATKSGLSAECLSLPTSLAAHFDQRSRVIAPVPSCDSDNCDTSVQ